LEKVLSAISIDSMPCKRSAKPYEYIFLMALTDILPVNSPTVWLNAIPKFFGIVIGELGPKE
tara:strand:+ start:210 stop:395 length:186 start_codon:yes stop_codon:yes gene_type:complete